MLPLLLCDWSWNCHVVCESVNIACLAFSLLGVHDNIYISLHWSTWISSPLPASSLLFLLSRRVPCSHLSLWSLLILFSFFCHGGCSLKGKENVLTVRFYLCCCCCLLLLSFFFKFRGTLKVDAGVMTFKWPLCHSNRWCNTTGSCFPASPLHHQQSQHIQQEQLHRSSLLPSGETLPPAATSRPLWPSQRWVPFSSNFSLCVAYLPSRTRCVCGWDTLGGSELQPELELCHAAPQQVGFQRTTLRQPRGLFARVSSTHTHRSNVLLGIWQCDAEVCSGFCYTWFPPRTHSIARLHSSLLFLCLHGWKPKTCTVNFTMFKRSEYSSWSNWLYVKWTLY